jgi:hypothetical protein
MGRAGAAEEGDAGQAKEQGAKRRVHHQNISSRNDTGFPHNSDTLSMKGVVNRLEGSFFGHGAAFLGFLYNSLLRL